MKIKAAKTLTAICIVAMAASAMLLGKYLMETYRGENAFRSIRPALQEGGAEWPGGGPEAPGDPDIAKWQELYAQNKDFVAWLKVPGTRVDYPVMQRKGSPEHYLHRDFSGNRSAAGTPFLSSLCDMAKPSDNLIIYGHHMRSGAMFATLAKLTDQAFCKKQGSILLLTKEGMKRYRVICVFRTQVGAGGAREFRYYEKSDFADASDFASYIENAKERAYYETDVPLCYGNRLITLSTCEYTARNGRLVVLGVLEL